MEHFKTNRGNQEFYTKVKDRDLITANLWRCVKKKTCKARYKTDLEDTMILGGRFEDRTIERKALRQTYEQKAVAEPCERPNKLITRSVNRGNSASTL